ncbi:hypothetical protein [Halomonas piscis]|uniref:hypothetical protein n=2 Tax=Halomonas piscis TaxID=3031727 RepID=UPI0028990B10|nr:hypothetical protein [Halomonas piscis]
MIEWISAQSSFLQFLTSLLTLAVWVFYAQLLLGGYLRQRRPKVVLNQVMELSTKGRFLISNMSAEGIHIESLQVWLHSYEGVRRCTVTETEPDSEGQLCDSIQRGTLQGPLPPDGYIDAGEISTLVRRARSSPFDDNVASLCAAENCDYTVELLVLYVYSSAPSIMGAKRTFTFDDDGNARPYHVETEQLTSRRERKKMADIYRKYLTI